MKKVTLNFYFIVVILFGTLNSYAAPYPGSCTFEQNFCNCVPGTTWAYGNYSVHAIDPNTGKYYTVSTGNYKPGEQLYHVEEVCSRYSWYYNPDKPGWDMIDPGGWILYYPISYFPVCPTGFNQPLPDDCGGIPKPELNRGPPPCPTP